VGMGVWGFPLLYKIDIIILLRKKDKIMTHANINALCKYIEYCITINRNIITTNNHNIDCITTHKSPKIPIREFIKLIFNHDIINQENSEAIILHLINMLNKLKVKGLYINEFNIHRLIFILILLACKIIEDEFYDNKTWAEIGNMKLNEINNMELSILLILDFDLSIVISQQNAIAICKSILIY
jgi:hypothetical protein